MWHDCKFSVFKCIFLTVKLSTTLRVTFLPKNAGINSLAAAAAAKSARALEGPAVAEGPVLAGWTDATEGGGGGAKIDVRVEMS